MTRARRAPSTRYPTLVLDCDALHALDGRSIAWTGMADALPGMARQLGADEPVVWCHETAGLTADAVMGAGAERAGTSPGWFVWPGKPKVHCALPAVSGDFAGARDAEQLGGAVELWREHVGMAYVISGPNTVHKLVQSLGTVPDPVEAPQLDPAYRATAWATPANVWAPDALDVLAAAGLRWVSVFDRAGSYLSAWRGAALSAGEWTHEGRAILATTSSETTKPAGYWLVEPDQLPNPGGVFDPWRRHTDPDGPVWLTTPLMQLAVEVAGEPIKASDLWWAAGRCRALDPAAGRLAGARLALEAGGTQASGVALRALKDAYSGATSWFEYGPRPGDPLGRPHWRHTILDRFVANTYRALAQATPAPFAHAEIDAALFALPGFGTVPDGLKPAPALGGWKRKGAPVAMADALAAYTKGGPRAVIALAEGTAA